LAAEASDGEGAPVRIGRGETVWELREGEARLMVGDVGVERACSGGSAAGWSSPGFKRGGGGVLRCGSEERARERGEWVSGVPLLLGRSLEESGGLCRGRSTATSRWRPSGRFWARRGAWHGKERASARQQEGEVVVRDAWAPAHGGVMAGKAGKASAGGAVGGRRREAEQGGGRWS
jgi:hypothetical protein